MVRRLLAAANLLVDGAALETVGGLRREQDMIDADTVILLPGAGLIIPERVLVGLGVAGAEGVGVAEIFDPRSAARDSGWNSASFIQALGSKQSSASGITL